MIIELIFWILIFIVAYSYIGYGFLLLIIHLFQQKKTLAPVTELPSITLFIAAYNEREVLEAKLANSALLDYPKEKLIQLWITDGSTDGSENLLLQHSDITVLHNPERQGKIGAINRGMRYVKTPIVIFSDANTMLSPQAIREMIPYFLNPKTGCVAGEKRIVKFQSDNAVSAGEGLYWKYESFIKKLESDINSTIGAVGELFAIRTDLFEEVAPDTILDDFVISLQIAQKGFQIKYTPKAFATECSSFDITEELKRKVRIGAGNFQALFRMKGLLNIFRYKTLSFQYWSHKVIRWLVVPFAMLLLLITNIYLTLHYQTPVYKILMALQFIFYVWAIIGWLFRNIKLRFRVIFAPYYIVTMNYALVVGMIRYIKGFQSVNWEKAKRLN
jgi:cellulose synthase/poly-beta-1,6-N-acetylglucosamine synthase-like glycosyltransferase